MANEPSSKQRADALYARSLELLSIDVESVKAAWDECCALLGQRPKGPQSALLHRVFDQAARAAQAVGWDGTVVLKDGKVLVEQDGVLLDAGDLRYFRKAAGSAAAGMLAFMDRYGIPAHTVFDVGANVGEIALHIARHRPDAQVYAFEPAADGLEVFEANIALQREPLPNLHLVKEAISDRSGEIEITVGGNSLNTVLVSDNLERLKKAGDIRIDRVPTDTLEGYCSRFGVQTIDLLKIDTEGGEPLLAGSIRALKGRIEAARVEISRYNTVEAYLDLIDAFDAAGLVMLRKGGVAVTDPGPFVREQLQTAAAINVWFLSRNHWAGR